MIPSPKVFGSDFPLSRFAPARIGAFHRTARGYLLTTFAALAILLTPYCLAAGDTKVLYTFKGGNDGIYPSGALVFDSSGDLFGTTYYGGTGTCSSFSGNGCGMVFELKRESDGKWQHAVLYNFKGGSDGAQPTGGLVFDSSGNLYGTTTQGGGSNIGTVFELSPHSGGWSEKVLHSFGGSGDGAEPAAGMIFDSSGNLYGTASGGGAFDGGAVFEISPGKNSWTEKILYSFCPGDDCSSGLSVLAGLARDSHGDLFGVTEFGGNGPYGTVFELKPDKGAWDEVTVHSFDGSDGGNPDSATLIFDSSGNFYGTTNFGGAFGYGTVFRFAPGPKGTWVEKVVYNFRTGGDGGSFNEGLAIDSAGHLYGANGMGGIGSCNDNAGCGLIYEVTPEKQGHSQFKALHQFTGDSDGGQPSGAPIRDGSGNLYGPAAIGGNGFGTIYEVTP
jgi:uncharacterized repeat protein (TIGR03803 family)